MRYYECECDEYKCELIVHDKTGQHTGVFIGPNCTNSFKPKKGRELDEKAD